MNRIFLSIILAGTFILAGCDSQEQLASQNNTNAAHPVLMANMPDGRKLFCIEIRNADDQRTHYIYYFSTNDTKTISDNYTAGSGKSAHGQTVVIGELN